jgi:hypothetical protein
MNGNLAAGTEAKMDELELRELAHREHDGLEITLVWNAVSNEVSVDVLDLRNEVFFSVVVAGERALDAFNHPYAYAPLAREHQHSVLV